MNRALSFLRDTRLFRGVAMAQAIRKAISESPGDGNNNLSGGVESRHAALGKPTATGKPESSGLAAGEKSVVGVTSLIGDGTSGSSAPPAQAPSPRVKEFSFTDALFHNPEQDARTERSAKL